MWGHLGFCCVWQTSGVLWDLVCPVLSVWVPRERAQNVVDLVVDLLLCSNGLLLGNEMWGKLDSRQGI